MNNTMFLKKTVLMWLRGLRPVIFSIIMLMLGVFCLLFIPQGRDAVLGMAYAGSPERLFFVLAALIWAFQIWYWARTIYLLLHGGKEEAEFRVPEFLEAEAPRFLGSAALVTVGGSLLWMNHYADNPILGFMGLSFLLLSVGFYFFLRRRREYFKKIIRLRSLRTMQRFAKMKTCKTGRMLYISELPPGARRLLMAYTGVALGIFVFFTLFHGLSRFNSSAAVMLLCFSLWIPLGSWILYFSYKYRRHFFLLLIAGAALFSMVNDNHGVRVVELQKPEQFGLEDRMDRFLERYAAVKEGSGFGVKGEGAVGQPLYIIAIEGGGIRSGFWAASLLAKLEERRPGFHRQVLAISAVSGGSLGAAVFTALVREKRLEKMSEYTAAILGGDFLSPTLATMFTGDILQEVLPFGVQAFSRALSLEKAWEKAWYYSLYTNQFSRGFTELWDNDGGADLPLLFLNSIQVETGRRIITAPTHITDDIFPGALDVFMLTEGQGDIPLSTAVHNSARFPYISPMGTLADGTHVADGGYFDNSGAATALDVLRLLRDKLEQHPRELALNIIFIINEPEDDECVKPPKFISGLIGPAQTFFNAWKAHTQYARTALRREGEAMGAEIHWFNLLAQEEGSSEKKQIKYPLGWTLSPAVQREAARQADKQVNVFLKKSKGKGVQGS